MCCNRRNRNQQCGGRSRGPIAAQLTRMAYDKYQERQAHKARIEASERESQNPAIILTSATSAESLHGVQPPSYEATVRSSNNSTSDDSSSDYGSDADKEIQWVNSEGKPIAVQTSRREQRRAEKAEKKAQKQWEKNQKVLEKAAEKVAKQYRK